MISYLNDFVTFRWEVRFLHMIKLGRENKRTSVDLLQESCLVCGRPACPWKPFDVNHRLLQRVALENKTGINLHDRFMIIRVTIL
jgi:hypothetical protein